MTNRFTPTLVICLTGAAAALAALGLPGESAAPPSGDAGTDEVATVEIIDFGFSGTFDVAADTSVRVINADGVPHTLTAVDGGFDTGVLDRAASSTFEAPAEPGVYEFFCALHPSMTGTLAVAPA